MKMSMKVIEDRGGGLGRKAKLCVQRAVGRRLQGREKARSEGREIERKGKKKNSEGDGHDDGAGE